MQQIFETEVWGTLTKRQFDELKIKFYDKLCLPIRMKRLSIQITDYAKRHLDTRIRITNGEAEIMQKIGDWDAISREEVSAMLPSIPEIIFSHWKILNQILDESTVQKNIIQMESYTYKLADCEVKLTHQSGSSDAYNFEVESFDTKIDPIKICKELGLKPDLTPKDAAYWQGFNERINVDARKLQESEILDIISQYCLR